MDGAADRAVPALLYHQEPRLVRRADGCLPFLPLTDAVGRNHEAAGEPVPTNRVCGVVRHGWLRSGW